MTSVLVRGSKSVNESLREWENELKIVNLLFNQSHVSIQHNLDELMRSGINTNEVRNSFVHKKNQNYEGYFAVHALDMQVVNSNKTFTTLF